MNKIKINDNRPKYIAMALLIIVLILIILLISGIYTVKYKISKEVLTQQAMNVKEIEWLDKEYEGIIDINDIIKENIDNQLKEVVEVQEVELEYETLYQNNSSLPKGKVQVLQQGQDGKQELIIKKQYMGEELISDEQIGRRIITSSIDRIVEVGTSSYYDTYKIKVGDTVYATPYELDIRKDPKKGAEVIIKITKDSK